MTLFGAIIKAPVPSTPPSPYSLLAAPHSACLVCRVLQVGMQCLHIVNSDSGPGASGPTAGHEDGLLGFGARGDVPGAFSRTHTLTFSRTHTLTKSSDAI